MQFEVKITKLHTLTSNCILCFPIDFTLHFTVKRIFTEVHFVHVYVYFNFHISSYSYFDSSLDLNV